MLRTAVIYKVTHRESGRVYIGQTRDRRGMRNRWSVHISCARRGVYDTYFHNALRKYGEEAFDLEQIEECTSEEANERGRFWISEFRANEKEYGFNMSEGGDGGQNTMSAEVRRKLSEIKKGRPTGIVYTEVVREKLSASKRGKRLSEDTIEKIKASRNGLTLTADWKNAISVGLKRSAKFSLSASQIEDIVARLNTHSDTQLASEHGVSRATIWKVRRGLYPIASNYVGDDAHLYAQDAA